MKMSLDSNCLTFEAALNYSDPAVIAGALKSYLREMPDPLMTHKLYNHWMNAASRYLLAKFCRLLTKISNSRAHPEERVKGFKEVIDLLPESHRDNLRYLIKFFAALCRNQDVNKMTPQNIAIVIAPNLIWNQQEAKNTIG
jgi:Rho GTPase-activating protein 17